MIKLIVKFTVIFLLVAGIFSGCTVTNRPDNAILNSLRNRGAVPLSSQNPYLAGNLLLSSEMQRSPELSGFINKRGAPKAIEVVKSWSKPTLIRMYYPEQQEYYVAESSAKTWALRGPQRIPAGGVRLLMTIIDPSNSPPLLEVQDPTLNTTAVNTNTAKTWQQVDSKPQGNATNTESNTGSSLPHADSPVDSSDPLINEVIRLKESVKEQAEVTPRGDVVHYVTYPGETLSMISRWYTLDARNIGRITRINNLQTPNKLEIGDTIVIPGYLVKNKSRFTQEALAALQRALTKKSS